MSQSAPVTPDSPAAFINRELSWLSGSQDITRCVQAVVWGSG